jgi:hypothetical protein
MTILICTLITLFFGWAFYVDDEMKQKPVSKTPEPIRRMSPEDVRNNSRDINPPEVRRVTRRNN